MVTILLIIIVCCLLFGANATKAGLQNIGGCLVLAFFGLVFFAMIASIFT